MQEMFLTTSDNIKIAINHYATNHKEVIILAPGWFMTKDSKSFLMMSKIFSKDFDVISMDFRGHGRSSGFYTFTSKEIFDIKTVVEYAKEKYKKVYLIGFSLGGALVLIHSVLENNIDKIICISVPSDFYKIENCMWKKEAWYPTIFKKFEPKRWCSIRPSILIRKKIKPIDIADKITVPTLFIAGEKDPTVYPWHTRILYQKATCPKRFELFKNSYHAEDIFWMEKEKFLSICKNWLELTV